MKNLIIIISLFLLGCNSDSDIQTWVSTGNPEHRCEISENNISLSYYEYKDFDTIPVLISFTSEIIYKKEINSKYQTTHYFVRPIDDSDIYVIISQIDRTGTRRIFQQPTYFGETMEEAILFWEEMKSLDKVFDSIPLPNSLVHLNEKEYNEISKLAALGTVTPEFYIQLLENSISFIDSNGRLNSYHFGGFRHQEGLYCKTLIQEGYNHYKSIENIYIFEKSYFEYDNNIYGEKLDSILNSKPFYKKITALQENLWHKMNPK